MSNVLQYSSRKKVVCFRMIFVAFALRCICASVKVLNIAAWQIQMNLSEALEVEQLFRKQDFLFVTEVVWLNKLPLTYTANPFYFVLMLG